MYYLYDNMFSEVINMTKIKLTEEEIDRIEALKATRKKGYRMFGETNPRWNGGNSEYPNHAELKRIRIEVLKKAKGKCEICGEPAQLVHHIDGDKSNHQLDNLMAVCSKCHSALHYEDNGNLTSHNKKMGRPNKYYLKYGMSIQEIAKIFNITTATVYYWIRKPKKEKWMTESLNNIKTQKELNRDKQIM